MLAARVALIALAIVHVLRAQAEQRSGEDAVVVRTAEQVVRDEPQKALTWVALGFAAEPRDAALARLAHERIQQLAPPVKAAP